MNAEGDGTLHSFQADLKISCYVTLHGKKLVVLVRDSLAENKTE